MMMAIKYVLLMFGIAGVFYANTLRFSLAVTAFTFLPFVLAGLMHAYPQSDIMQYLAPALMWGTEAIFSTLFALHAGQKAAIIENERRVARLTPNANSYEVTPPVPIALTR